MTTNSRWQQRFTNYQNALPTLTNAAKLAEQRPLSNLEQQVFYQQQCVVTSREGES